MSDLSNVDLDLIEIVCKEPTGAWSDLTLSMISEIRRRRAADLSAEDVGVLDRVLERIGDADEESAKLCCAVLDLRRELETARRRAVKLSAEDVIYLGALLVLATSIRPRPEHLFGGIDRGIAVLDRLIAAAKEG